MTATPASISVQLYSLRAEAESDFAGVLRRLGQIGYTGVELAGLHDLTAGEVSRICQDSGLVVSSAHVGSSPDTLTASFDDIQEVGCDTAFVAFLPPSEFVDLDAVKKSAEVINATNAAARSRGISLGYHNHWWEFETIIDGRTAYDHLYERLDNDVIAELDIYWATVGGADPVAVMDSMGGRVKYLHVKDGPADDPASDLVAVGTGAVDITGIVTSAPAAAVGWHVVELDRCATDMFTAIEGSYSYLTTAGLSRGRK